MRIYEQEAQKQIQRIATAGPAIAAALGKGWTFTHYADGDRLSEYFFNITHTDGTKLAARKENDKGRFMFTGDYPGRCNYSQDDPRVGLDLNRPAKALAADLHRRLIPDVRRLTKERFIYEAKQEQKAQRYQALAYELAANTGATLYKSHKDELCLTIGKYPSINRMETKITRYESNGTFDTTITISDVTPEMAQLIGQMIAADHKKRTPIVG